MFSIFYPHLYEASIFNIPYNKLKTEGILFLLFDLDNTIVQVNTYIPATELIYFFLKLKDMGFKVCILSNGKADRVKVFAEAFDAPFVAKARKPLLCGINKAFEILSADAESAAIIGDQIFTDILCGKRKKIYTILIKPISETEEWFIKPKRFFERFILDKFLKG